MRNLIRLAFVMATLTSLRAQLAVEAAKPPLAAKKPKDVSVHGDKRIDDYFWMRDEMNPEVLNYLRAENAHAEAVMAPNAAFREKLYAEMLGRIKETDQNPPARKGP